MHAIQLGRPAPRQDLVLAAKTETSRELPRGKGQAVLVVDESPLSSATEEMLTKLGYKPAVVRSGAAALEILRAEPERFRLVLVDEVMPQLSGIALAAEIRWRLPQIPIVLMSGYSGLDPTRHARLAVVNALLRKPFLTRDIAATIARVLAQRE